MSPFFTHIPLDSPLSNNIWFHRIEAYRISGGVGSLEPVFLDRRKYGAYRIEFY
jgi:hypothetical protein